ncbi:hypothetical protein TthAA37_07190 [Thermus thermophilus]|nr:hypothetical protein TthAA37_07190 [Thermus thermophilus]
MRVAFVHDWLTAYAGAEKVLEAALELYPTAPIYTLVYQQESFKGSRIAEHPVHTSFIERLPKGREKYRAYLPLMPLAIEQFDLSGYDVVISSSHAVAKGVLTRADQLHISYVHTPIRYAWDLQVVSRVMCKSLCTGGIPLLKHLLQHLLHLREPL